MNKPTPLEFILNCDQFAANNQVKAQTVRARVCRTGSYFGVKPLKLANGRTAWPNIQIQKDESV